MKLLLPLISFLLPLSALAQQKPQTIDTIRVPSLLTASDTAEYKVNRYVSFFPGTIRLMDGRVIQGYMPVLTMYPGIDFTFAYYLTHPNGTPKPPKQEVQVAEVQSMTAGNHYFETMRTSSVKKAEILAERFVNGPVEVFLQAEQQNIPLPIPLPGVIIHTAIPYKNSHFFVRRNGLLTKVNRGIFKAQMSQYLSDYPELAKMIARDEKGYRYPDLMRIVTNYNSYKAHLTSTGQ